MTSDPYALDFSQISAGDVPAVGGKNASLGEMFNTLRPLGVNVVDGFATTAAAYRALLSENRLAHKLRILLSNFDPQNIPELEERANAARAVVLQTPLPAAVREAVSAAYARLCARIGREPDMAVRSSATAEDLPEASFAGQQESFLNVRGFEPLLHAIHSCMASLFTDRAISYRSIHSFDHFKVALSVGIQPMIRSDLASSGVMFTLDPESGFRNAVVVSGSYGLGEFVVQGVVSPDEWTVFKPTLAGECKPIIGRRLGSKETRLVYAGGTRGTRSETVPPEQRKVFCLTDAEVLQLARWGAIVEQHYSELAGRPQPMDIEWAKDGASGRLFILQARPETVHSVKPRNATTEVYRLRSTPPAPVITGQAVGERIASGRARVVTDISALRSVKPGEILVAQMTDPDWEPVMKQVAAIVTDRGGRTAHAAIVSRELGLPCVVGTGRGTRVLETGQEVTVCCAEGSTGKIYPGILDFEVDCVDASTLPATQTAIMLNVADPDRAFKIAEIPNEGVGLARIEFIIADHIGVHPMAIARYPDLDDRQALEEIARRIGDEDPREFFIRRLSEGIGKIAAAFYPKPVIVRTSDFKTSEYAQLLGGREFEPQEPNPMLGFRGASRYYDDRYADGFGLECAALLRVRRLMGLSNLKIMIPFCRTVTEGARVLEAMAGYGLTSGKDGLEIYAMCELPSNVILASQFLKIFDGFSIGSNDLTQLVLGIDRDSGTVAHLFDERNDAVKAMIGAAIRAANNAGKYIGICGQAPSDYPDLVAWLVDQGIGSISLNPDSAIKTRLAIAEAERIKVAAATRRP